MQVLLEQQTTLRAHMTYMLVSKERFLLTAHDAELGA